MARWGAPPPSPQRKRRSSSSTSARDTGPDLAADEDELHLAVAIPSRISGLAEEPIPRGLYERLSAPAPGQGAAARARDPLHVVHGRALVLPLPRPHPDRNAADVLLPADDRVGLLGHQGSRDRRHFWSAPAEHAPLGRARHGHHGLPAHDPRLLHRLVQTPARVQLGHRHAALLLHDPALLHGIPAPLGPALVLGGHGRI